MMNRYGHLAREHHRNHRPDDSSQIPNPDEFFTTVGEEIAEEVSRVRDEILGQLRPGENLDAYRLRGYQAMTTAEELVLSDHYLFQPDPNETTDQDWEDDPDLARRYRLLAEINETINQPL